MVTGWPNLSSPADSVFFFTGPPRSPARPPNVGADRRDRRARGPRRATRRRGADRRDPAIAAAPPRWSPRPHARSSSSSSSRSAPPRWSPAIAAAPSRWSPRPHAPRAAGRRQRPSRRRRDRPPRRSRPEGTIAHHGNGLARLLIRHGPRRCGEPVAVARPERFGPCVPNQPSIVFRCGHHHRVAKVLARSPKKLLDERNLVGGPRVHLGALLLGRLSRRAFRLPHPCHASQMV